MLKKRIIPCLDIKDGRTVKGVNFVELRDAGDPVELAKRYAEEGADELVFLDITATVEKRETMKLWVEKVASVLNIPFTVGGGVKSVPDAAVLLKAGADKIGVNSAAVKSPQLISELAEAFGKQCVVLAVDIHPNPKMPSEWEVYVAGGRKPTGLDAFEWITQAEKRGAGELLLTSMAHDGTKKGFANKTLSILAQKLNIPIIASGGAGAKEHFKDAFTLGNADAALAASVFHFGEIHIPELKKYLKSEKIPVRC